MHLGETMSNTTLLDATLGLIAITPHKNLQLDFCPLGPVLRSMQASDRNVRQPSLPCQPCSEVVPATKPKKVRFANFWGRSPELALEPPLACKYDTEPLKRGFWNKFRTPCRKFANLTFLKFLWFGLPELLLTCGKDMNSTLR